MDNRAFIIYLAVSAGVTYLIRMVPLVLSRKKIQNRFLLSFLQYIPYAVLSAMTVPAIFYSTSSYLSAAIGFAVALVLSFFEKSLVAVAAVSCSAVLATELIMNFI